MGKTHNRIIKPGINTVTHKEYATTLIDSVLKCCMEKTAKNQVYKCTYRVALKTFEDIFSCSEELLEALTGHLHCGLHHLVQLLVRVIDAAHTRRSKSVTQQLSKPLFFWIHKYIL